MDCFCQAEGVVLTVDLSCVDRQFFHDVSSLSDVVVIYRFSHFIELFSPYQPLYHFYGNYNVKKDDMKKIRPLCHIVPSLYEIPLLPAFGGLALLFTLFLILVEFLIGPFNTFSEAVLLAL